MRKNIRQKQLLQLMASDCANPKPLRFIIFVMVLGFFIIVPSSSVSAPIKSALGSKITSMVKEKVLAISIDGCYLGGLSYDPFAPIDSTYEIGNCAVHFKSSPACDIHLHIKKASISYTLSLASTIQQYSDTLNLNVRTPKIRKGKSAVCYFNVTAGPIAQTGEGVAHHR